jgi:integrase
MRKTLTDAGVRALKPRAARYAHPDPELAGHYVRVQPSGTKSFVAVSRDPSGKQIWATIGSVDLMSVAESREKARAAIKRVMSGKPAFEILAKAETFADVVTEWRTRHLERNGLRAAREINRLLIVHILPAWGAREMVSIRRSDVAALLDRVEDGHGGRSADYCLTIARAIMNWHAARRDDYSPPIIKGMRRQSTSAQARTRILDDDEIRRVWTTCGELGTYGAMLRMLLLTAQRFDKALTMAWVDLDAEGVWRIPTVSKREKPHGGELKLPRLARDLIAALPVFEGNPFVFAGRGQGHSNGHSKNKARLDRLSGVTDWVVHDLRRTARSLLSRAGVRPDIAERTLGHVQPGVANVYDRHAYFDEKADALAKLAALIDRIVDPRPAAVAPLRLRGTTRR